MDDHRAQAASVDSGRNGREGSSSSTEISNLSIHRYGLNLYGTTDAVTTSTAAASGSASEPMTTTTFDDNNGRRKDPAAAAGYSRIFDGGLISSDDGLRPSAITDTSASACNDIFEHEQYSSNAQQKATWWNSLPFELPSDRTLLGAWDGVFSACVINIFGVVIFLRTGWMVGVAGVGQSLLIILLTVSISVVAVLSAVGISERANIDCHGGGVYSLLRHVIGARISAAMAIVYCFGQSVACALCVVAFGESIVDLLLLNDVWLTRSIAIGVLIVLTGMNMVSVRVVVGVQLLMLVLLFVAILDFVVGSFIRVKPDAGIIGFNFQLLLNNTGPDYNPVDINNNNNQTIIKEEGKESFFSVLGVFFPSATGVLAGFNMRCDINDPTFSIPVGTLTAIGVCTVVEVLFIVVFGSTCERSHLRTDYMIADKMSATRVLWLIGLYELSLSSALGNLGGTPNVLHGIFTDNVIPGLAPLAYQFGPNQIPVVSIAVMAAISLIFVFIGQLNILSTITAIPFMLTYVAVNYAHFTLQMSDELKRKRAAIAAASDKSRYIRHTTISQGDADETWSMSIRKSLADADGDNDSDLDRLFPEERRDKLNEIYQQKSSSRPNMKVADGEYQLIAEDDVTEMRTASDKNKNSSSESAGDRTRPKFSLVCNKWISLIGAVGTMTIMFAVECIYTLFCIAVVLLIWILLGRFNPGAYPAGNGSSGRAGRYVQSAKLESQAPL